MMKEIYNKLNAEWGCKIVDDKFFLGVRRDTVGDANSAEMTVELTMNAYAEDMHGAFESWLPSSHVVTPFPEHINVPGLDRDLEAPHLEITIFF